MSLTNEDPLRSRGRRATDREVEAPPPAIGATRSSRTRIAAIVVVLGPACGRGEHPQAAAPADDVAQAPDVPSATPEPAPEDPWTAAELEALRLPLRFSWPVENVHITSTYGWRTDPATGAGMHLHHGLDFGGHTGDLVLSIGDGTVAFAGHDPALGNLVVVDHGHALTSRYAHLSDVLVHEGVPVQRGAAIGLVGNTGQSHAPHLHLGIELDDAPVDPLLLLGQPPHTPDALVQPPPTPQVPVPTEESPAPP